MFDRKLVAVLACRCNGSRLYGKPLQNLDISTGWKILDQVIQNISKIDPISETVLAIASTVEDIVFVDYAKSRGLRYVLGDQHDVLERLISGARACNATDIFRVTTESPFLYWEGVVNAWTDHLAGQMDATFADEVVDGCNFEIIRTSALVESWERGEARHRSEMSTLFIRENEDRFAINRLEVPGFLKRKDLRLTVDNPEDLVVCREVYKSCFTSSDPLPPTENIIAFLDSRPDLRNLVLKYCETGYSSMYL